jgi:(p)ppGpp synthase/HD superfamily hydrolase
MSTSARIYTASRFFVASHDDQTYGPWPYEVHLLDVVNIGKELVTDDMLAWALISREEFEIGCWGHDSVEDTPVTLAMITALYGNKVSGMIDACTDVEGKNRHDRKWGTEMHPGPMVKLQHSRAGLLGKICDRLANGRRSKAARDKLPPRLQKKDKYGMYCKEYIEFRETLYVRDTPVQPLWDALDELFGFSV